MTETKTPAEQIELLAQYERERDTDRASIRSLTEDNARLRSELDRLNAGRQKLQRELDEAIDCARRNRHHYRSLAVIVDAVVDIEPQAHLVQDDGHWPDCPGCAVQRALWTPAPAGEVRLPRPLAELEAWAEYWRREAEQAGRDRDGHRATAEAAHREIEAALQALDVVLVDPDAPDGDETGEPDDPGELLPAAETVVTRLRLAEVEVVRLATEVERLSAGEVPLPGAPELTR